MAAVGDWISQRVFGTIARTLVARAPCAVRVVLPPAAADLAFLPLELARVDGRPLAVQRVSLVIDVGPPRDQSHLDGSGRSERPAGHPLRVLGLFSLPHGSAALNLRKERHELDRLVGELAGAGRAIELRSLQYGATRERLAAGGEPKVTAGMSFTCPAMAGRARSCWKGRTAAAIRSAATSWWKLLSPLRGRVKLVMVSSCDSGERVARRQLEILAPPGEAPPPV